MITSINKSILIISTIALAGCTSPSCFKAASITDLTIMEAAKTVSASAKNNILSSEENEKAAKIIKTAAMLSDKASNLCLTDKTEAMSLLNQATSLITSVEK